ALEQYDDALSSGQQAFLLEETNESPDMFQLSVGILLPGGKASVSLDNVKDELKGVLSAHVSSPHPISKVESNCPLNYLNTEKTQATVSLAAGHQFDRDVELLLYYTHQPTAIVKAAQASAKPGEGAGLALGKGILQLYGTMLRSLISLLFIQHSGSIQRQPLQHPQRQPLTASSETAPHSILRDSPYSILRDSPYSSLRDSPSQHPQRQRLTASSETALTAASETAPHSILRDIPSQHPQRQPFTESSETALHSILRDSTSQNPQRAPHNILRDSPYSSLRDSPSQHP
ncbi:unnamed protein product, partial [Coregonus sp. 'balchen']